MIYSIGYQGLPVDELERIVTGLRATIVDVRGTPRSRNPTYSGNRLAARFGERYEWRGDELGNHGKHRVTDAGLERLAEETKRRRLILMCMEKPPGDCHRHHQIAVPLFERFLLDVWHIYEDEVVSAAELARSITEDRDYRSCSLESVLL